MNQTAFPVNWNISSANAFKKLKRTPLKKDLSQDKLFKYVENTINYINQNTIKGIYTIKGILSYCVIRSWMIYILYERLHN